MRVLLIEDDALLRSTLSETLEAEGIELHGLANAEDALVLLGAGDVPDVLVTEVSLREGLDGSRLAAMARASHADVAVILIGDTAPDVERRSARPHERYLRKPLDPAALAAAIRDAGKPPVRGMGE